MNPEYMTENVALALVAALSTLISGIITWGTIYFKGRYGEKKKEKKTLPNLFKKVSLISQNLKKSIEETECTRACIFVLENGGGQPVAHKNLYSTIRYEEYKHGKEPIKKIWQRRIVDEIYHQNMRKVNHANGRPFTFTRSMFEKSTIYSLYEMTNTNFSFACELYKDKLAYVYVSFDFDKEPQEIDMNQRVLIEQVISNLQNVFSDKF